MRFEHFIITLFSFRGQKAFKKLYWPGLNFTVNPLKPDFIEHRLKLFQMTCLPGILSQTSQDFNWIIVIDKELPSVKKNTLKNLVLERDRTYFVEYDQSVALETTEWLKPYLKSQPDYIFTSNHDDDDMLPKNFISSLHSFLNEIDLTAQIPAVMLMGSKKIIQWDIFHTKKAPFGYFSPWHRGNFPSSCGFSLLSKFPETNISVIGLVHRRAEDYIDFKAQPKNKHVTYHRNRLITALNQTNQTPGTFTKEKLFYDIGPKTYPVLMTNHSRNAQFSRLYEKKALRQKVTGPKSFPGTYPDWHKVEEYITGFKKNYFRWFESTARNFMRKLVKKSGKIFAAYTNQQ
jgi:hypothetical protein